jgi:Wound-induced protein
MASTTRASLVTAACAGTVDTPKDQAGLCRLNYALRSMKNSSKNNINISSISEAKRISKVYMEDKADKSEESLRTVMYLSCWGPY